MENTNEIEVRLRDGQNIKLKMTDEGVCFQDVCGNELTCKGATFASIMARLAQYSRENPGYYGGEFKIVEKIIVQEDHISMEVNKISGTQQVMWGHGFSPGGLFVERLMTAKTTPLPMIGSYGCPYSVIKCVHLFNKNYEIKVLMVQRTPLIGFPTINAHRAVFKNYGDSGDAGEGLSTTVDITKIRINDKKILDRLETSDLVHNGYYGPLTKPLIMYEIEKITNFSYVCKIPMNDKAVTLKCLNIVIPSEDIALLSITEKSSLLDIIKTFSSKAGEIKKFLNA